LGKITCFLGQISIEAVMLYNTENLNTVTMNLIIVRKVLRS
jgi:hypothetical protein